MNSLIREMNNLLERQQDFALATIIRRNGSAPRTTGAKMLVRADESIEGTVGGGALEAEVIRRSLEMLKSGRASVQSFSFSGADAASMDAICGGQVDVLIEGVAGGAAGAAEAVRALGAAAESHRSAWLVTTFEPASQRTSHAAVLHDGQVLGAAQPDLDTALVRQTRLPKLLLTVRGVLTLIEPTNISGSVYIFGAGHVSRSLAQFTRAVDFWTVVIDDRADYANRERFPQADQVVVLPDMADISSISIEADGYVVIVTRGHMDDLTVLAQVLRTPAAYIGMIGSRRKVALIFDELRKKGYSEADLQRVHAPIGLPIGAETPEEIGISISAELIQKRARLREDSAL